MIKTKRWYYLKWSNTGLYMPGERHPKNDYRVYDPSDALIEIYSDKKSAEYHVNRENRTEGK